jgi:hypothetical protein
MPEKLWDSDADWGEWDLVHLEIAEGAIRVAEGYTSGTATSPVYNAVDFEHEGEAAEENVQVGTGCNVYARFRSGATSNECSGAAWSPYYDIVRDGVLKLEPRCYCLNNPTLAHGAYWQFELTLEDE